MWANLSTIRYVWCSGLYVGCIGASYTSIMDYGLRIMDRGLWFASLHYPTIQHPQSMSERNKPHNGRDRSGHYKVKQADVEDLRADPQGEDFVRDDVRLGGAVEDTGIEGAERAKEISKLVDDNREDVNKLK